MSVNFYKHRDELVNAWKDVMNEKTQTDWALFGYEKQSNDLMVVDSGVGGLQQMVDELNSGKILYAFCKVIDPTTDIPKYVLINWQGEGAPLQRKGVCINHFRDVSDFFKGSHMTINARTEDDVEPSVIMSRICKDSARVNVKERLDITENIGPVGTNYKRVQPQKEINQTDRENFWMKTQEDERKRVAEEKKRAAEARNKIEHERKERELTEAKKRDETSRERDQKIFKIREAQENAENVSRNEFSKEKWSHDDSALKDENERRKKSEMIRKERTEETSVISHGSIKNARAIFEQNTSAGQMNSIRSAPPKMKIRDNVQSIPKPIEVPSQFLNKSENENVNSTQNASVVKENAVIKEAPIVEVPKAEPPPVVEEEVTEDNDVRFTRNLLQETYLEPEPLEDIAEEEQTWDEPTYDDSNGIEASAIVDAAEESNVELKRARALYDYQAADDTEISFDPDDLITHIEQIDEGWWQGMAPDGSYGLFPANYVELID